MRLFCFVNIVMCACLPSAVHSAEADSSFWEERYMSVSQPLEVVKVNSPYGWRTDPLTKKHTFHGGLDLEANGALVYAMFGGTTEKVGEDSRSGRYVIMRHGRYTVSYCHLSKVTVHEGQAVMAGAVVAVSGNTGRSTGPHLHITVKHNGEHCDPSVLLSYVRDTRAEALRHLRAVSSMPEGDSPEGFLERYAPVAQVIQGRYGIPASVLLSQMAHESDFGRSRLAKDGYNFFGMKCTKTWLDSGKPYILADDDKPNEKFRRYGHAQESIDDYVALLMSYTYRSCRQHKSTDYHGWLQAIKACGYATNAHYVRDCEAIIKEYRLWKYDKYYF